MSTKPAAYYQLKCGCNSYPWGKKGKESLSARLCQQQPGYMHADHPKTDFRLDDSEPYAEMWMGTYPTLPSFVASTGENLQDVLDRHSKELIGEKVINKFGHSKLPYLPKVLSIAKALPLQLHPDIEHAKKLHKEKPDAFTDPNHKPEIALALGKFEAFCGFKPLNEIAELMKLDPLKRYMPKDPDSGPDSDFTDQTLKHVVKSMLEADDDAVKETYNFLARAHGDHFKSKNAEYIPELAPRLAQQYAESDPGILVALITMNYLVLDAGDSIYIPADGIHAYLSGDIIECMARSNNVLNTGFCPRAERSNIDLFTDCLTFKPHDPNECMLKPKPYSRGRQGKTQLYAPPLSEFSMLQTSLKKGDREELAAVQGPSIVLVSRGSGHMKVGGDDFHAKEGSVWFVAQGQEVGLEAKGGDMLVHIAFVE